MQNKKNLESSFGVKNSSLDTINLLDFSNKKSYFKNFDLFSVIPLKFLV
jgi:hypothetical protein